MVAASVVLAEADGGGVGDGESGGVGTGAGDAVCAEMGVGADDDADVVAVVPAVLGEVVAPGEVAPPGEAPSASEVAASDCAPWSRRSRDAGTADVPATAAVSARSTLKVAALDTVVLPDCVSGAVAAAVAITVVAAVAVAAVAVVAPDAPPEAAGAWVEVEAACSEAPVPPLADADGEPPPVASAAFTVRPFPAPAFAFAAGRHNFTASPPSINTPSRFPNAISAALSTGVTLPRNDSASSSGRTFSG